MPFFSVVIPLYNKQNDVKNTLLSVIEQTFPDFEIIVINDGSTDESENEVLTITDKRLVYIKTENKGVSMARNLGIEKAQGNYIAFLDADDYWYPNHLEILKELIVDYPEAGIVAANYEFKHPNGFVESPSFPELPENYKGILDNPFKYSLRNRIIISINNAVKKESFNSVGKFDNSLTTGEDTDMWIRLALNYPVAFNKQVTSSYLLGASNRASLKININTLSRLDKYNEEEQANPFLKKFLDIYRAQYAMKYKLTGDKENFNYYYNSINLQNQTFKTRILLILPPRIARILYRLKQSLKSRNIHFDIYN